MANPVMFRKKETPEERKTRELLESLAWDCTVGAGNLDGDPEDEHWDDVEEDLKRLPTPEEKRTFIDAWFRCQNEAAQP